MHKAFTDDTLPREVPVQMAEAQPLETPAEQMRLNDYDATVETRFRKFEVEAYYPTVGDALAELAKTTDRLFSIGYLSNNPKIGRDAVVVRHAELSKGATIGKGIIMYGMCQEDGVCSQHSGTDVIQLDYIAKLKKAVPEYHRLPGIEEFIGSCLIIESIENLQMHGVLREVKDPITLEAPDHECYGVRTDRPLHYYEIKRVMRCPCQA